MMLAELHRNHWSFLKGVIAGVFTVPGDPEGCIDYRAFAKVLVNGDSQLVVNQIMGKWKVKNEGLRPYWQEARELMAAFAEVHVRAGESIALPFSSVIVAVSWAV